MNIHEYTLTVDLPATELFRILNDEAFLSAHMPRTGEGDATVWLRIDEPEATLSWGSPVHHLGSLDVLPAADPSRTELTLRVGGDSDLTAAVADAAQNIKDLAEGVRLAA